jgi:hypothetical protein
MKFNTYDDFILYLRNNNICIITSIPGIDLKNSYYFFGFGLYSEDIKYKNIRNYNTKDYFLHNIIHILFNENEYSERLSELMNFVKEEKQKQTHTHIKNKMYYILDLKEYYDNVFDIKILRKRKLENINL